MQIDHAQQSVVSRQPPGGKATIMFGDDSASWMASSEAHSNFQTEIAMQASPEPRMPPGGVDSVKLGGPVASPAAEELLARPSPGGGEDSIAFGKDSGDGLPAVQLLARASPGGADSVDFSSVVRNLSAESLLARSWPGGATTMVLGSDNCEWGTDSQAHGVGSAEAAAMFEVPIRPSPGGADSISFATVDCTQSSAQLLTRPFPGGTDSVDFSPIVVASSSEELRARPYPGGSTTVVLGGHSNPEWTTNSQVHGAGSAETIAAAEPTTRRAPGGADSIEFGAAISNVPAEMLLTRRYPGGDTKIFLGCEEVDWKTNSSTLGAGSVEAIAQAQPLCRPPPGGTDSVETINSAVVTPSVQELLARPHTGGKTTVLLGGDDADWVTSSDRHSTVDIAGSQVVVASVGQAPGGVDSVDFASADVCTLTADELLARPAPGGTDSVDFAKVESSTIAAADLLIRPSPGGAANIILGSDDGAWATSSQTHNGTPGVITVGAQSVRPPPGGVDSVVLAAPRDTTSVDDLLARPACGGAASVVLGMDDSNWSTWASAVGVGARCATTTHIATGRADSIDFSNVSEQVQAKALRVMCPAGEGTATLVLSDQGVIPERFTCGSSQQRPTTRMHQDPGGNSSIDLSDGSTEVKSTSANRFANGSNQNQGNWMTDRSTTRLHQAPGGNSSINLGDDRTCPTVGVSASRFAKSSHAGETSNAGIRVKHAPGGASSLCLADCISTKDSTQDENANTANIQITMQSATKTSRDTVVKHAPGGNATVVLG